MASVPAADSRPYNRILKIGKDYDQELKDTIAKLQPLNFPVSTWTVASLLKLFLTTTNFLKKTKIVLSISDPDLLSRTLNLGVSRGFWIDHASCTPVQLYKFCLWLRTPDGVKAREDVYFQIRILNKKRKRDLTPSEEKREVELQHLASINDLQEQIRNLRKEQEEERIRKCDDSILKDCEEKGETGVDYEARIDELKIQIQKVQKEEDERVQRLREEGEKIIKARLDHMA